MLINNNKVILFIEPKNCSKNPIIDELTIKMFNAMGDHLIKGVVNHKGDFIKGLKTMGLHECICGKVSRSYDILLDSGQATNFLSAHYLAFHRDEVPEEELQKVRNLQSSNVINPTDQWKFDKTINKDT